VNKEQLQNISDILHELDQRAAFALKDQKYDEALAIYGEILRAQETLKLEKFSGHTMINMANIHTVRGEYETALEYIDRAAALKALQKDPRDSGNIQILRANIFFLLGRAEEAEALLTQECKRNRDDVTCGQIELVLYSYYMRAKKYSKARTFVDKAINHFRLGDNQEELRRALACRIEYFRRMGQAQYAKFDEAELSAL